MSVEDVELDDDDAFAEDPLEDETLENEDLEIENGNVVSVDDVKSIGCGMLVSKVCTKFIIEYLTLRRYSKMGVDRLTKAPTFAVNGDLDVCETRYTIPPGQFIIINDPV